MSDVAEYDGRFDETPAVQGEVIAPSATALPSNPFAATAPEHISAGAVAIESQRGIAEVQGRMVLAKKFPRDSAMSYAKMMTACLRIGLAQEAIYKYKRGGGPVEGPSIRLAEEMARHWGNIEYGLNELSRRPGESEMEAFAWDLETNVRSSQRFTVRHIRDRNEGAKALDTERDIYEITANMGARRMRSRILAILPPELVRDAIAQCRDTVRKGGGEPLEDRIKKMMAAFQGQSVTPDMIAEYVGHPIDKITPDELVDLGGIYQSLKDNQSKPRDWFGKKDKIPADGDAFEQASAGQAPPKEEPKPDPELPRAQDFIRMIGEQQTLAEVENILNNGAVRRVVDRWRKEKPDLAQMVDESKDARLAELRAAA